MMKFEKLLEPSLLLPRCSSLRETLRMATQPRPSLAAVPQTQRRSFLGKVAVTPAKLNPRRFFRRRRAEQDGGVPLAHLVVEVLEAKLSHRTGAPHDAFCHITYANSTVNSPTRSSSTTRSKALVWAKENAPGDARLEKVIYENNQFGGERVAEIILWGKGMTRKEYIGEISLEIQDFWPTIHSEQRQPASYRPPIAFNDPENKVCTPTTSSPLPTAFSAFPTSLLTVASSFVHSRFGIRYAHLAHDREATSPRERSSSRLDSSLLRLPLPPRTPLHHLRKLSPTRRIIAHNSRANNSTRSTLYCDDWSPRKKALDERARKRGFCWLYP